MAHTVSYGAFSAVRLAGSDIGESEIFTIRAGELGVPVGLMTSDQVGIDQLRKRAPWIESVEVKRARARQAGDVIPPERTWPMIRDAARRAVERAAAGELRIYTEEPAPYAIGVDLREPPDEAMRANLARLPEFEIDRRSHSRHAGRRHGHRLPAHRVSWLCEPAEDRALLTAGSRGGGPRECLRVPAGRPGLQVSHRSDLGLPRVDHAVGRVHDLPLHR